MTILEIFKAIVYTAVFSLAITPFDFRLASAIGAIDTPKDERRMHKKPVPRIGGLSLFISFLLFCMIFCKETSPLLGALLTGTVLVVVVGIIDDCNSLNAYTKLIIQLLAAVLTLSSDAFRASNKELLFFSLSLIWVLTLTNAHNFIDGLDGLCAGISANEAVGLGVILWFSDLRSLALASFVLGGACIGFLPYNAKNAKIFMGDTGSTFLGFLLGTVSAYAIGISRLLILPFLFIFLVPLCDIAFAVTRRLVNGKNPFAPDRSHIHHLLADRLGHAKASYALRTISAILVAIGIGLFFLI